MMISRLLAGLLLLILLPIFTIIAIVIIVDDGLPVIYRQKRVGIDNTFFSIYKFRTMKNNLPDIPTHQVHSPDLLYIHSGATIRKLSLDELPQLFNIILGDMGFVGPRPALHNQDDLVQLRTEAGVHKLLPGVTGWAQVKGRDELSIPVKVKFDKEYLTKRSFMFDLKIILYTFIQVFRMKGVSH